MIVDSKLSRIIFSENYLEIYLNQPFMSLFDQSECSVLRISDILGKKWVIFILSELIQSNNIFFNDLQDRLISKSGEKISARILSLSLKTLENESIITREVEEDTRRVKYSLSEKGKELEIILSLLKGWSIKWDDITFKRCKSFSCVHDSVPILLIDKLLNIYPSLIEKK